GQSGRERNRWEPRWRFTRQPILSSAARTRLALLAGQLLIRNRERDSQGRRRQFPVSNAIRYHLDGQPFGVADGLVASLAVAHNTRQLEDFGYPAAVLLAIQINRQIHSIIIHRLLK